MAIILNKKKSTYSSPYAYYTVEVEEITNRTATEVELPLKITSNLASSSSRLGTGYTLKANLYAKGSWSSDITLKASNESWSGTTKHYKYETLTISGLTNIETELDNIQFRVISSAGDNASGLNATNCENIIIPSSHEKPTLNTYIMTEQNQDLINAGIIGRMMVKDLSIKSITIDATFYDDAQLSKFEVYNYKTEDIYNKFESNTDTVIANFKQNEMYINPDKARLYYYVTDNQGGLSSATVLLDYISYEKPYIIDTSTKAKRIGQITGRVGLTINGTFYNNEVGNVDQGNGYKPTIYYKYWETGTSEPQNYIDTISTASVSISSNTFNVTDYDIGSSTDTDPNYFDPTKSYRIKIKVVDNFSEYESNELSVPLGESIWDEYKDHVDFKKITIKGENLLFYEVNDIIEIGNTNGTNNYTINGYITNSSKTLYMDIRVNKSLRDITTITCNKLNVESRGVSGYLNNSSGYTDYVSTTGYTIDCYKIDNYNIKIAIVKSSVFTNVTNNTPVSLTGEFKFTLT